MRAEPPAELVELLSRAGLATVEQVRALSPRVRQLAGDLPLFPSVWIDALLQSRRITPFQAAEINAGRGDRLAIGPFVLESRLSSLGDAEYFRARELITDKPALLLVRSVTSPGQTEVAARLSELIERLRGLRNESVVKPLATGSDGDRVWLSLPSTNAKPLREILRRHGRMSREAVTEIARQMAAVLGELQSVGIAHGALSLDSVWVTDRGQVRIMHAGVREALLSDAAFDCELPPQAIETLSPEQVADGASPSTASDIFSCGCLWWHLLTGRSAHGGGATSRIIHAIRQAKIPDVRRYAPETPAKLAAVIKACCARDPRDRPESFPAIAEMLGPAAFGGQRTVERIVGQCSGGRTDVALATRRALRSKDARGWAIAVAACLFVVASVSWPLWRRQQTPPFARTSPIKPNSNKPTLKESSSSLSQGHQERQPQTNGRRSPAPANRSEESGDVQRVGYVQSVNEPPPLVLDSRSATVWPSQPEPLRPGQTIRGRPGERPMVFVPATGIVVAADDVRFENVDFVWRPPPDAPVDPERIALVDLRAAKISFKDCTFQAFAAGNSERPMAIRWSGPRRGGPLPPAGRLQLAGCVLAGVAAGVEARMAAPIGISLSETLYFGPGPLVRLNRVPKVEEPIELALSRSTIRDAAAVLAIQSGERGGDEPGAINVTANECAFAPRRDGALVMLAFASSPAPIARSIQWAGQGSVLDEKAAVGTWLNGSAANARKAIEISLEGLVASRMEFAGPEDAGSSASRLSRWLAPTQSAEPPGIPDGLPNLPRVGGD